jgi:hypothetical protein
MRYEYEEAADYARIAVKATQGVSQYIIGPAIRDVLSSGGMWVATTAGRAVMGSLLRPPDKAVSDANSGTQLLTERTSVIAERINLPRLHLIDAVPALNMDPPVSPQPYEDLVA